MFYLKTTLLLIGAILIFRAAFIPVTSKLQFTEPENYETLRNVFEKGYENFLWYMLLILIVTSLTHTKSDNHEKNSCFLQQDHIGNHWIYFAGSFISNGFRQSFY